jgi:hypothetical protein
MHRQDFTLLGGFQLAALAGAGCGVTDVTVARLEPVSVDSGPEADAPHGCGDAAQCSPSEYCEKTSCSDEAGVCLPAPTSCDYQFLSPRSCGCNGIFYLNDCLRQLNREPTGRGCGDTKPLECTGPGTCPSGSFCFRQSRLQCATDTASRECWSVPETCPSPAFGVVPCTGPQTCTDLCTAIRSEQPFQISIFGCPTMGSTMPGTPL